MSFLISRRPVFNQSGATDMYELLYKFTSKKNPDGDISLITEEEVIEAKEYLKNNMDTVFDGRIAYIKFSPFLLDNNFNELFLKERLIIEIPAEMLSDASSTLAISTPFQDSGQNAWVLLFPTLLNIMLYIFISW